MEDGERSLVDDSPIPSFFFFFEKRCFCLRREKWARRGNKVKRQRP